jgi:hypothetical protein
LALAGGGFEKIPKASASYLDSQAGFGATLTPENRAVGNHES